MLPNRLRRTLRVLFLLLAALASISRAADKGTAPLPTPSPEPAAPSPIERLTQVEKELKELQKQVHHGSLDAKERESRLRVGAFGDINYEVSRSDKSRPWVNRFVLGKPSFFFAGKFGPHLSFVDENIVEFDGTNVKLDVDRVLVSYFFHQRLRLCAGRDHAATGYWNRHYGYAGIQQTTIERPFFLEFEDDGGVLPAHLIGLCADGTFPLGGASLQYEFNVGNAPSLRLDGDGSGKVVHGELDCHLTGDGNNRKAVVGRLSFKPWATRGLSLGTSAYFSRVDAIADTLDLVGTPSAFQGMGQLALEGEVVWRDETLELLGEYYLFNDKIQGAPTQGAAGNRAFYIQAGVRLTEHWMPYVRAEDLRAVAGDPYFAAFGLLKKSIYLAGVRVDMVPKLSAIKLEGRVIQTESSRSTEAGAQWAFGF